MDLSVEEFCVQAAGRIKGQLTFQGYPVRLNPKLSVCRQLHNKWLDATGRDVSYEEFKRSLRFSMKNGQVAVRMAYDPTKFVVAGLAGVGATAAAVGGYQWWKSQKGKEIKCVEPDYSKWDETKWDELGVDAKTNFELNKNIFDRLIKTEHTMEKSKEEIKEILNHGKPITEKQLAELIELWNGGKTQWSQYRVVGDQVTYVTSWVKKADRLTRPEKYWSDLTLTETDQPEFANVDGNSIFVVLDRNQDICEQVKRTIENGTAFVTGAEKYETDLFEVKSRLRVKYVEIPNTLDPLCVQFINPDEIQNVPFKYCSKLTHKDITYKLVRVHFEDESDCIQDGDRWIIVIPSKKPNDPNNAPDPAVYRIVPNGDLSILCKVPDYLIYKKEKPA